ncbi:MAG: hypothetical protein ACR2OY_11120 [Boseongicola sp.]
MTTDNLKPFLHETREALFDGDLDALAQNCVLPLVVYSPAGVLVIKDREHFLAVSEAYRQALAEHPITQGSCVIVSLDPMRNRRTRVTAHWTDMDSNNTPLVSSTIRYFLLMPSPNVWKIEMLEYLEIPIPIETAERIIH